MSRCIVGPKTVNTISKLVTVDWLSFEETPPFRFLVVIDRRPVSALSCEYDEKKKKKKK